MIVTETLAPRPRLRASAIMGVIDQLGIGLSSFAIFALVLRRLGPDDLGLWSLALTAAAIAGFFSFPSPSTLLHHLANSESRGDFSRSAALVETAIVMITSVYAIICIGGYVPFLLFMKYSVPAAKYYVVLQMLPIVFLSIFISNISNIFFFSLVALHKTYLSNTISIIGTILTVVITFYLFDIIGITGAAIGLLSRPIVLIIVGSVLIKKYMAEIRLIPPRFNYAAARDMSRLSTPLQIMSLCAILWEPFTRISLGLLGVLDAVSFFAIAWRIVWLPRGFINSSIMAIAPVFGAMTGRTNDERARLQQRGVSFVFGVMPLVTAATIGVSPIASELLFGHFRRELVMFTAILALGVFWEGLSLVLYFRSLGEGRLKWTLIGYVATAALNVAVGGAGAWKFGPIGAVGGYGIALALGSMIVLFGNVKLFGGRARDVLSSVDLPMSISSALALIACLSIYASVRSTLGIWLTAALMIFGSATIVALPTLRFAQRVLLKP